ncbi:MAG: AAA family ATPase [Fusobacteriaceae bacterium]
MGKSLVDNLKKEMKKKIVGQDDMIDKILIALLTGNHILLEGLPGLAKSLTVNTMSETLGMDFSRIQFTPDLLPSDVVGTEIYNEKTGEFHIKKGPIFGNVILADEINRAPAKVQSALLEAMQERQVTIANETYKLEQPFIVLATQNPIEQDGTYQLPEAQQDRFIMKVKVEYPTREEEMEILESLTSSVDFDSIKINKILSKDDILNLRKQVKEVHVDNKLKNYIVDIVFKTRENSPYITCGASPRATIAITLAAKANAFLNNRDFVMPEDIKRVIYDVLRHRILLSYEAEAEDRKVEEIIENILDTVVLP